jgi:hypothetical protein
MKNVSNKSFLHRTHSTVVSDLAEFGNESMELELATVAFQSPHFDYTGFFQEIES